MKSNLTFSLHIGFAIIHSQSYSLIEVHILSTNSSALLYFLASSYSGCSSLLAFVFSSFFLFVVFCLSFAFIVSILLDTLDFAFFALISSNTSLAVYGFQAVGFISVISLFGAVSLCVYQRLSSGHSFTGTIALVIAFTCGISLLALMILSISGAKSFISIFVSSCHFSTFHTNLFIHLFVSHAFFIARITALGSLAITGNNNKGFQENNADATAHHLT
jgi:hypothetical protein